MQLVTACPNCNAVFYVTPDQLSAHHGDVRCGKCSHVFNANQRLAEIPEENFSSSDKFILIEDDTPAEFTVDEAFPNEPVPDFQAEELPFETPETDSTPPVEPAPPEIEEIDFSVTESTTTQQERPAMAEEPAIAETFATNTPFAEIMQKSSLKWSWLMVAVLLLILIALQAVYYLRTPIAAKWPALKHHLIQACSYVNCTVELPQEIHLILLDDSNMQEDTEREGLIHLSSTLVNQAPYAQAYPLLELSLTDTHDTAVLRRTFAPAEYLPAGTEIRNGIAPGEEVHIKLTLTASGEPVAGYRILATYH